MDNFQNWLSSLPTPGELAPTYTAKRGEPGYIRGVPSSIGQNKVPGIWTAFAPYGKSLIDQGALARLSGTTAGIAGGRHEFERSLLDAYRSAGVDPLFARRQLAESRPQVGAQIRAARGDILAQRADDTFNLETGITNALTQSYIQERNLGLELYLASMGRKDLRDAGKSAQRNSLLGLGAQAAGALFGPLGAAAGTALASSVFPQKPAA